MPKTVPAGLRGRATGQARARGSPAPFPPWRTRWCRGSTARGGSRATPVRGEYAICAEDTRSPRLSVRIVRTASTKAPTRSSRHHALAATYSECSKHESSRPASVSPAAGIGLLRPRDPECDRRAGGYGVAACVWQSDRGASGLPDGRSDPAGDRARRSLPGHRPPRSYRSRGIETSLAQSRVPRRREHKCDLPVPRTVQHEARQSHASGPLGRCYRIGIGDESGSSAVWPRARESWSSMGLCRAWSRSYTGILGIAELPL